MQKGSLRVEIQALPTRLLLSMLTDQLSKERTELDSAGVGGRGGQAQDLRRGGPQEPPHARLGTEQAQSPFASSKGVLPSKSSSFYNSQWVSQQRESHGSSFAIH
eukprot:scaffold100844_cov20-Prasinocladus_malaysianus.AAC.1